MFFWNSLAGYQLLNDTSVFCRLPYNQSVSQFLQTGLRNTIGAAIKVILKICQARLQQNMNQELPDVQAGFRKGRGTRDQIANICWIIKKAGKFQKYIYFCFIDDTKAFDCVGHKKVWKILRDGNTRPPDLPPEKSVSRSRSNG